MEGIFSKHQIDDFINNGYVKLDGAFDAQTAEEVRNILWNDMDVDPHDRSTWTKPVVRLGWYSQEPFVRAANTPVLHQAFDQLVGRGRWVPCMGIGTFPVRFPSPEDPGDTGWHVDAGFAGNNPSSFFDWRINGRSKGRGLLMLFLFSDVGEKDAPTRIRVGSHLDVARLLSGAGEEGLTFKEVTDKLDTLPKRSEVLAVGDVGTVYLCHPFLAHAAQPHQGTTPRFLAQPPLLLKEDFFSNREGIECPVEQAIRLALAGKGGAV